MDPILTLGLISIVGGGLFLIILSLFFHCLVAIIECIGNTVTVLRVYKCWLYLYSVSCSLAWKERWLNYRAY